MSKRVLIVATVVKTHIMEFHIPYLQMFKDMGWETAVASRNDYDNPDDCLIPFCDKYYDVPFERSPFAKANIKAYRMLKKLIDEGNYDIIHCHTPVGAMLTRIAAKHARKKGTKVIYTAHGFHFFKGAPLKNWLMYYPVEWLLAHDTDVLITINREDHGVAQKLAAGRVHYVPGVGIDTGRFGQFSSVRAAKREELGFDAQDFVLLSVGELIARKNHEVVLRAMAKLKDTAKFVHMQYVICGQGVLAEQLRSIADDLGIAEHVHFLGYRRDIADICNASDLFVFMSHQEGLPVALMEAMSCGMPIVCSRIRGNTDLIDDDVEGCLINNDANLLAQKLQEMMQQPDLRARYGAAAREKVKLFDIENVKQEMWKIYTEG